MVAFKQQGESQQSTELRKWSTHVQRLAPLTPTVEEILGRRGFLGRAFSFARPTWTRVKGLERTVEE